MANRLTGPTLLLLAGICVLPARSAAADDQEKKPGATRPAISQEVAPLEAIAPVAKDGHKGEAYVRKPPGKGPFPAVVLIHGDIVRWPTTQLKEYVVGAWSSRYLAAGYVVAVTTYRSRDVDPQTRESPDDVLDTVEYVRKLSYVDPKSIVVNGTSGGGDLALTVATETDVAVIVVEEPAGPVTMGVFNKNTPKKGERFTPFDGSRFRKTRRSSTLQSPAITPPVGISGIYSGWSKAGSRAGSCSGGLRPSGRIGYSRRLSTRRS